MDRPGIEQVPWTVEVGIAKVVWARLGEDELLAVDGDGDKLTALVEQRYAISREEALKQVTCFFKFHHGEASRVHASATA